MDGLGPFPSSIRSSMSSRVARKVVITITENTHGEIAGKNFLALFFCVKSLANSTRDY